MDEDLGKACEEIAKKMKEEVEEFWRFSDLDLDSVVANQKTVTI